MKVSYTFDDLATIREAILHLQEMPQLAGIMQLDVFAKGCDPDEESPIHRYTIHTDGEVYVDFD